MKCLFMGRAGEGPDVWSFVCIAVGRLERVIDPV